VQLKELRGFIPVPIYVAGQATAATVDEFTGYTLFFKHRVAQAVWIPKAAITANATNYFTLTLRNRGTAGAGTVNPATRAYSATNSTALAPENMTLSSTATDLVIASGEHVSVEKLVAGTGLAMPAGTLVVYVQALGI